MPAVAGPTRPRPAWGVVVVAILLLPGCRHDGSDTRPVEPTAEGSVPPGTAAVAARSARTDEGRALDVLREWDARRSEAFASGGPAALRRLHVPGSPLAERDVALVRRYRERGLRVTRLQQQVVSVEVHVSGSRVVRMTVVDRLAPARVEPSDPAMAGAATGASDGWTLPASEFARRVLRFERVDGAWRLSWARAV